MSQLWYPWLSLSSTENRGQIKKCSCVTNWTGVMRFKLLTGPLTTNSSYLIRVNIVVFVLYLSIYLFGGLYSVILTLISRVSNPSPKDASWRILLIFHQKSNKAKLEQAECAKCTRSCTAYSWGRMIPTCESLAHFYNAHSKFSHMDMQQLERHRARIHVATDLSCILSLQLFSSYHFKTALAFTTFQLIHHKFCLFHSSLLFGTVEELLLRLWFSR